MPHDDTTKQAFLDALAKTGNVGLSLRASGIASRQTVNAWRRDDEVFSAAYDEAIEDANDTLEAEAHRRAVEGVTRLKALGSGENMTIVEEVSYSDTLLLALLKANKPEKFAERSKTELTSPDGSFKPDSSTESAARIAALLDEARRRREAGDPLFE